MAKKDKSSIARIEKAVADLLDNVSASEDVALRLSVIDRAIKLEALKVKLDHDEWGSEFMEDNDD